MKKAYQGQTQKKSKFRKTSYRDHVDVSTEAELQEGNQECAQNRAPDDAAEQTVGRADTAETIADLAGYQESHNKEEKE